MKIINHVMSQDINSNILTSFIKYLSKSDLNEQHITSIEPIENADIYHYHRPHLENKLLPNSIVTVHHDLMESDPWLSLSKFLKIYQDAKAVVCLNSIQKKILSNHKITNTYIIPHGYNASIFDPNKIFESDHKEKLTLALISKRYGRRVKGEAYFLELIKRLDNNLFDFILVGDGRSEEFYLLQEYGFDARAYEKLPYRIFDSLYEKIDFLLMLSSFEGGPANVPEAIVSGVPVAGFPIGMVPDFIKDQQNGIILTGDFDSDAQRLMHFAKNRNYFNDLKKTTQEMTYLVPTWEDVADMYNQIYIEMEVK
jgi:glycosyltransferase involved in cell wall biosynthesis